MKTLFIIYLYSLFVPLPSAIFIDYQNEKNWPTICYEGSQQSPINIPRNRAFFSYAKETYFQEINYQSFISSSITYTNGLLKLSVPPDSSVIMKFNGLTFRYNLIDIIIHSPSEHTFDSRKTSIELQLIHKKDVLHFNMNNNVTNPNLYLYMISSVFFQEGVENPFLNILGINTTPINANLRDLISPLVDHFYLYEGSFPYPSCSENVLWVLFSEIQSVSANQMSVISQEVISNYGSRISSRKTQAFKLRFIYTNRYYNFLTESFSSNSLRIRSATIIVIYLVLFSII